MNLSMARDGEGWHVIHGVMRLDSGIKKSQGKASAGWVCFGIWDEGGWDRQCKHGLGIATVDKRAVRSHCLKEKSMSRSANVRFPEVLIFGIVHKGEKKARVQTWGHDWEVSDQIQSYHNQPLKSLH